MRCTLTALFLALLLPAASSAQEGSADGDARFRLTTQLRATQQWEPSAGGRPGASPRSLRVRLGAEVAPASWVRAVARLQHARGWGRPVGGADGVPADTRVHEGFLELAGGLADLDARARVGRQEIALGNERLVGTDDWSPAGRSFDAARVLLERGAWAGGTFIAQPLDAPADPWSRAAAQEPLLVAGHLATPLGDAFVLHEDDALLDTAFDVDRTTAGVHLRLPEAGTVRAGVEWAYQLGTLKRNAFPLRQTVEERIEASLLGLRLGLAEPTRRLDYVGVGVDRLSGDERGSSAYGAFHAPWGSPHRFYGQRDVVPDVAGQTLQQGLVDAFVETRWRAEGAGAPLEVALHRFWSAVDGYADDRRLGWELDLRVPTRLGGRTELELGYSVYRLTPGGSTGSLRHWGYARVALER